MKTGRKSPVVLLKLIYVTLLTAVSEAQEVEVWPEVTGYLGLDVTLHCRFIPGLKGSNITQVQWDLKPPEGKEIVIIVWNPQFGHNASGTFLKDRVEISGQSLIIRAAEMRDAGLYKCSISAFPGGSFQGTTRLVIQEQMPLSSGEVSAIVIAVVLLFGIIAAIVYFVFRKRRDRRVRHRVYIGGPVMDVFRPSVLVRDEDVVYSDVKLKPSREASPPPKDKHRTDDVTYSEVLIMSPSVMV
ncbi:myelin protein zero-like protein 2 isoform X2 [Centropristis striata]|uniref:myelin protein zero-like protein 2 isoform X2 n=1 Tax=Centropristis striata TaxID=184440 RepID=UPI0027E0E294|nr:myelin protein zero-like protein 2 isoform X2 [Centropristis striata]